MQVRVRLGCSEHGEQPYPHLPSSRDKRAFASQALRILLYIRAAQSSPCCHSIWEQDLLLTKGVSDGGVVTTDPKPCFAPLSPPFQMFITQHQPQFVGEREGSPCSQWVAVTAGGPTFVVWGRRCCELGVGPHTETQGLHVLWRDAGLPLGMLVGTAMALKGQHPNVAPGGRQIGPVSDRTRFRGPTVCLQSEMQLWLLLPAVVHGEIQAEALPFVSLLGQLARVGLLQSWSCGVPDPPCIQDHIGTCIQRLYRKMTSFKMYILYIIFFLSGAQMSPVCLVGLLQGIITPALGWLADELGATLLAQTEPWPVREHICPS